MQPRVSLNYPCLPLNDGSTRLSHLKPKRRVWEDGMAPQYGVSGSKVLGALDEHL